VAPELERLRGQRMICVYGTDEKDSGCRDADSTLITRVQRKGGHHFDGNFKGLGELIVQMLPPPY
jgi:type IV secretory pathway VirJ component